MGVFGPIKISKRGCTLRNFRVLFLSYFTENRLTIKSKKGSATLEYVIVSTFAALLSIAAITFVGKMVKEKVNAMASKVGVDAHEFDFDLGLEQ